MADLNRSESVIVITDKKGGLPFSKGILASSIAITGIDIITSHKIAMEVEEYLVNRNKDAISLGELRSLVFRYISEKTDIQYAEKYLLWQSVGKLKKPLIILIGGATGVGKSIIATVISNRLNIARVTSTDAIREVMRASVSEKLIRPLRGSSYNAYQYLALPPSGVNPVILGFREQVMAVTVGIEAIINRSIEEKYDTIIEGAHVVPGYLDMEKYKDKALIEHIIVSVDNMEIHKEHFRKRTFETQGSRPIQKYIEHIDKIRIIQEYIEELAQKHNATVIDNYDLDHSIQEVLELLFTRVKKEFSKVRF
jgi:2-phosphoglycerate kinase